MKLKDLIMETPCSKVLESMVDLHKQHAAAILEYKELFEILRETKPYISSEKLSIILDKGTVDARYDYITATGFLDGDEYTMEDIPVDQWLGYEIAKETLESWSPGQIIATCMQEMAWWSYDNGYDVEILLDNIKEILDEATSSNGHGV